MKKAWAAILMMVAVQFMLWSLNVDPDVFYAVLKKVEGTQAWKDMIEVLDKP